MKGSISIPTSHLASHSVRSAVVQSGALALACLISYELITRLLASVYSLSAADDLIGGVWAVMATIFTFRLSYEESVAAGVAAAWLGRRAEGYSKMVLDHAKDRP